METSKELIGAKLILAFTNETDNQKIIDAYIAAAGSDTDIIEDIYRYIPMANGYDVEKFNSFIGFLEKKYKDRQQSLDFNSIRYACTYSLNNTEEIENRIDSYITTYGKDKETLLLKLNIVMRKPKIEVEKISELVKEIDALGGE